jgi:hypothetical protein
VEDEKARKVVEDEATREAAKKKERFPKKLPTRLLRNIKILQQKHTKLQS